MEHTDLDVIIKLRLIFCFSTSAKSYSGIPSGFQFGPILFSVLIKYELLSYRFLLFTNQLNIFKSVATFRRDTVVMTSVKYSEV